MSTPKHGSLPKQAATPLFSQLDVTSSAQPQPVLSPLEEHTEMMRDMLSAQDRTNELLEELISTIGTAHKQRAKELNDWREANPHVAEACREAAETLSQVQVSYLDDMTEEIHDTREELVEGSFILHEFIDRYGPRLAHLNGMIQVLAQLSSVQNVTNAQN